MKPTRIEPGPGQESVWDYPRPPIVEATSARLVVRFGGVTVAETTAGLRVLETSQPPAYYVPPGDVALEHLEPSPHRTFCEWKGQARHLDVRVGDRRSERAAWTYDDPSERFAAIEGFLAFYPQRVDACSVDGEEVQGNAGDFYGGWITSKVVGPFKGGPGSSGW